jgi:hypothetical protein
VWEPPRELLPPLEFLRAEVPVPGSAPYTLFFPIELTNKDYLRRVFDIVAMGIQATVRRMIGKYRDAIAPIGSAKDPYDFSSSCDLYYLTKHIIDKGYGRSAPVYAQGQPLVARRIVSACNSAIMSCIILTMTMAHSCLILFQNSQLESAKSTHFNLWRPAKR